MKTVKLKSKDIVIPFEDTNGEVVLELSFKRDDRILVEIIESIEEVTKRFEAYEQSENFTYETARERVKEAIDTWLGDGVFDKLFALSPSVTMVIDLVSQVLVILGEELGNITREKQQKINKYLKK